MIHQSVTVCGPEIELVPTVQLLSNIAAVIDKWPVTFTHADVTYTISGVMRILLYCDASVNTSNKGFCLFNLFFTSVFCLVYGHAT